jgi:predicted AlkP superfamily phosphohydrolase/phosphomutase
MVLSDHGFCSVKKEVFVNRLLANEGWLRFSKTPPASHEDIHPKSRAFSFDPGRIYLNMKGREPDGCVRPGEDAQAAMEELTDLFMELRDPEDGTRVVKEVRRREDLFHGPEAQRGPDMVAIPRDGYDLKGPLDRISLFQKDKLLGMHTYENAFVAIRDEKVRAKDPEVMDGYATVLELMGEKSPEGTDSRPMI